MRFSSTEQEIINNSDFLLKKRDLISRIEQHLREDISAMHSSLIRTYSWPTDIPFSCKLSKGENYLGLPYVVFDHPNLFGKSNTLAFRTMFWWGNAFSATIHLGGQQLVRSSEKLLSEHDALQGLKSYICINKSPWHYHFEQSNYVPLTDIDANTFSSLLQRDFVKIAIQKQLHEYDQFIAHTKKLYSLFLKCL